MDDRVWVISHYELTCTDTTPTPHAMPVIGGPETRQSKVPLPTNLIRGPPPLKKQLSFSPSQLFIPPSFSTGYASTLNGKGKVTTGNDDQDMPKIGLEIWGLDQADQLSGGSTAIFFCSKASQPFFAEALLKA